MSKTQTQRVIDQQYATRAVRNASGNTTYTVVNVINHSALNGLSADDHAQYLLATDAGGRTAFAVKWLDLTDGLDTTLHTHDGRYFTKTELQSVGTAGIHWSNVSKVGSNLNEIQTRSHTVLSDIGTNTHANIDTHIATTDTHVAHSTVSIIAGDGLTGGGNIAASKTLTLGTPSSLTVSTTNTVTATSHTHAITSSPNPGAAASLLATNASGLLTLANLAMTGSWYKTGAVYQYYEVAEFHSSGDPTTGTLKITLPKYRSSTMMVLRIIGFQYTSTTTYGRGGWEAIVSGYSRSGSWVTAGLQAILHGEVPFSQVRLADDGVNDIILLGDTSSLWYYPKISVAYAMMGHLNPTGWETGWSISVIADETGITTRQTPAIYHAPPDTRTFTAGNGLEGGGDFSANRTMTLGTPSSLTATTTNAVTSTSHTHSITTGAAVGLSVSSTNTEGSGAAIARADHTHAIATSSNPGVAASILASDASGNLNLQGLYIRGTRAIPSVLQLRSTTIDSSWATGDLLGAVEFYSQDTSSPGQGVKAAIRAVHVGTATSRSQTGLIFTTDSDTEAMRIDHLGNVGIGKSPDVRLSVFDASQNVQARFGWTTTAGLDPIIRLTGRNEADTTSRHVDIQLDAEGYLYVFAPSTTTPTVKALIADTSGKVGIGVTPTSTLHVSGTGKFTGSVDSDVQFLGQASDTVSAPSFSWTSDTNTGMWRPAADTLSVTTGGTEVARFAVRDIALFNSTLEPWNMNYRGLQLGAYASIMVAPTFNAGYTSHLIYNAYFDGAWKYQNGNPAASYMQGAAGHTWRVAPSGSADAALTWTAAMTLDLNSKLSVTGDLQAGGTIYADGGIVDFGTNYLQEATDFELRGTKALSLFQTIKAASWNITTTGVGTFTDVVSPSIRAGAATELVIGAGADIQLNPTGVVKLANNKLIRSASFTSGWAGNGWQVEQGTTTKAEFDDLTVRGTMRVYELLIQQIRATNGSIYVTSSAKLESATLVSGSTYRCVVDANTNDYQPFAVGDVIRAQRVNLQSAAGLGATVWRSDLTVTAISVGGNVRTFDATLRAGSTVPAAGMDFVRLGSSVASRQGSVYLTADDSGAPFIDVVDGITTHADWNTAGKVKARFGKLDGLGRPNANEYGFWAGSGVGDTERSVVASNFGVELNGVPVKFKAGSSTVVMQLDPGAGNASPSFAMGAAIPTAPLIGNGVWMGKDGADYEFRVGSVSGGELTTGLHWDGAKLNIKGSLLVGPGGGFTVKNAWLHLAFDTTRSAPLQPSVTGHKGQDAIVTGSVIAEQGVFGSAIRLRPAGTNYISNPSFETDTSYWTIHNEATYDRITTDAVYGSACASITTGATDNPYLYRKNFQDGPTLATGQTWTFSLYVKAGNAGAVGKNVIVNLRENGSGAHQTITVVQATDAWQRVVVTRTLTHATPTTLNHYVVVTSSGGSGDVFLFDAIQLEQTSNVSPYIDSTMPGVTLTGTNHVQAAASRVSYDARQTIPLTGSISMWVKPVKTDSTYVHIVRYDGAANYIILRTQNSNNSWNMYWGATSRSSAVDVVQWDTWQHVVLTCTGSVMKLYVNGVLLISGSSGAAYTYHASNRFNIGYEFTAACGWVDDLFTTENVLTADEVAQIYASGLPVHCPTSNYELKLTSGALANITASSGGIFAINANGDESFALVNTSKVWGTLYSGGNSLASGDLVLGDPDQFHFMYDASAASMLIGKTTEEHIVINAASLALKYNTTAFATMTASDFVLGTTENIRITPSLIEFRNSGTVIGSLDGTTLTLGQTTGNHVVITSTSLNIKFGANTPTISMDSSGNASFTGAIDANSGFLGTLTVDGTITVGSSGKIMSGATAYNAGTGIFLGYDGSAHKFRIGTTAGSRLLWDGTDIEWYGTNTSLTKAGLFTASNASITGAIDANSGTLGTLTVDGTITVSTAGTIVSGATAYGSGTGIFLGYDGAAHKFRIGTTAGNRLLWDGTDIEWYGVNTSLTKAGLFTAANANITGAIDANSGTIGSLTVDGVLTVGTGGRIASGATAWGTGTGFWFEHNSGNPRVRIGTAAGNRLLFETSTGILTIVGDGGGITAISGSNITTGTLNASVVTVTNLNASNITTGTLSADRIATGSLNASKIESNTITGTQISGTNLSAIFADMGTISAGSIVIGTTNKIWLNDGADGSLAIGGATKASAPFRVSSTGVLNATGATIVGNITAQSGSITGTLSVGVGGKITTANADIDADGFLVRTGGAWNSNDGYRVNSGTTTYGGLWATFTNATDVEMRLQNNKKPDAASYILDRNTYMVIGTTAPQARTSKMWLRSVTVNVGGTEQKVAEIITSAVSAGSTIDLNAETVRINSQTAWHAGNFTPGNYSLTTHNHNSTYAPISHTHSFADIDGNGNISTTGTLTVNSDGTSTHIIGKAKFGIASVDNLYLAHIDKMSTASYALAQTSGGLTILNSASGQSTRLAVNNTSVVSVYADKIDFAQKINAAEEINADKWIRIKEITTAPGSGFATDGTEAALFVKGDKLFIGFRMNGGNLRYYYLDLTQAPSTGTPVNWIYNGTTS